MFDQHLHSKFSFDSRTEPADNVAQAIAKGLDGLIFTEHFDTHPDDWPGCVYDDEAYSAEIEQLRVRFGQRIFIGKGIEVCYQPDRADFILDFLNSHRFDMIILSVHYFAGKAVHKRDQWQNISAADGTGLYLSNVRDAVRWCRELHERKGRVFDVLGHLDVVKRYTQRYFGQYDVSPHAVLIGDILQACLDADLTPEINTSSLRQGLSETMPGPLTVRRYAELGGRAMSIGSDAHRAEDVGAGFDTANGMLAEAGLQVATFREKSKKIEPVKY